MKIGITGGIGSGKSYVCKRLAVRGIEAYDCDVAAKRLINNSQVIREQLTVLIGDDTYVDGVLNKAAVARFLLESEANAKAIDAVVHPAVFRDFEESGMQWMESAIMYESGICSLVDRVVVVTAPDEVRISRVMQRDGISREKVLQWMQRQWPQQEVCRRADYEIVNDGVADIDEQIDKLLNSLYRNNMMTK
jgi:dephospho-CoA kinase